MKRNNRQSLAYSKCSINDRTQELGAQDSEHPKDSEGRFDGLLTGKTLQLEGERQLDNPLLPSPKRISVTRGRDSPRFKLCVR